MRRRDFLKLAAAGLTLSACRTGGGTGGATGGAMGPGPDSAPGPRVLDGIAVIDIHAHPDCSDGDGVAKVADLVPGGLSAACFAVVGDSQWSHGRPSDLTVHPVERPYALRQIKAWLDGPLAQGRAALVRTAADLPGAGATVPGAILAIEGGDPLEGRADRVDEFYGLGVRLITLIHYRNNEIGDTMRPNPKGRDSGPFRGGLSPEGREIITRMEALGMVVDVAHASAATLADILAVATKPVIDSHTGPCHRGSPGLCGRLRTPEEMRSVVAAGGVVCSWAYARPLSAGGFAEWAGDIMEMKDWLGAEGVGLGTDTGGHLNYVSGYRGWRDLDQLAQALVAAGMTREELAGFFGGNVRRVLGQCLG